MSVTLSDYAHRQYPGHSTDLWRGVNPPLQAHTVIVHVVGRDTAEHAIVLLERALPPDDIAAVLVHGSDLTIIPSRDEDVDGVLDLPTRRIAAAAATGAVLGLMVAIVVGMAVDLPAGGVVAISVFLTAAFAAVGGIVGGARLASERAGTQAQAPGEDIGVVAAMVADEESAMALADDLTDAGLYDVRIVSSDGAWHAPG
jgi:hypothetical protein